MKNIYYREKAKTASISRVWLWCFILIGILTFCAGNARAESFDLTAAPSSSSTSTVTWSGTDVTITLTKNSSSTNANNYIPTSRSYTRMYANQKLTITPKNSKEITSVDVSLYNSSYPVTKKSSSNCGVSTSGATSTITPTDGKSEFYVVLNATAYIDGITVSFKGSF